MTQPNFQNENYQKAFEFSQQAANQDNVEALDLLTIYYKEGKGVEKDYFKALEYSVKTLEVFLQNKKNKIFENKRRS